MREGNRGRNVSKLNVIKKQTAGGTHQVMCGGNGQTTFRLNPKKASKLKRHLFIHFADAV